MAYPNTSRSGHNYLGNSSPSKREVHHLNDEKTNCQIDEILKTGYAVGFFPDTLQ
jgi:hypothetical protein